ncbi:F-box/RNI-like superfamily protein [Artemisia annua]|uniref:F-box/RNI-like superfamily protein n=1 Tax=Artemisia annua TaxID=35608 RepID=A0A2U1NFX9_ARTAN|nr:F-box/RNI-like superfamily protein [Artemisia annua]
MSDTGQERYVIQNMGDRFDYISQLPDCILHHILSFIPSKDVLKTSVLSKRWNNVWTSVSNLDLDDALLYTSVIDCRDPPEETCFVNFVERVLTLRGGLSINRFRLSCRVYFDASRIYSWVSAAVMHNVQELDLCVFVEDPFVLPRSMFCSQTLTSLKLEINCVLEIPDIICFPRLKTLYLSLIIFPDNDSTQRLLTGCRALEELVILDCEWILKDLTISSLTLERLTIDDLPYFGPPDSDSGCKIKIYTPKLLYLNYRGYPLNEIFLCDVSSLVETYISVPVPHAKQKEVASHVVDLLKGVRKVVSLTVADNTIESLVFADDLLTHLPVFKNLTHLELSVEIGNSTIGPLMKLLNCCPNLQSLHFAEVDLTSVSFCIKITM